MWRSLSPLMRLLCLAPILAYLAAFAYLFFSFLVGYEISTSHHVAGVLDRVAWAVLIGLILFLALAVSLVRILRMESRGDRPQGVLGIPPPTLMAFGLANAVLFAISLYGILSMNPCKSLDITAGAIWLFTFTLGNLLLFIACVDKRSPKGRFGDSARILGFLNGILGNAIPVIFLIIVSGLYLCGGAP